MPDLTPDAALPAVAEPIVEKLAEARRLTLELEDLYAQVEAAHTARGQLLIDVRTQAPHLSCGDIGAAIGVNRQRVWTLVDEARNGSRRTRKKQQRAGIAAPVQLTPAA